MKTLYTYTGIVIHGHDRGKALGYPTANIAITETMPHGVYASTVIVEGKLHHAATFIGPAETFHETEYLSESYLFDFDEDLYGKTLTVTLHEFMRPSIKFDGKPALIDQMKKDCEKIRSYFKSCDS